MKVLLSIITVITFSLCLSSCAFVPVNNQYEKAGTLKKGNIELSGNVTGNSITGVGESAAINNNFGFRAGYGITDKFDLKIRYERLIPTTKNEDGFNGANYISIVPKFALIPNKLSLLVPLSRYSFTDVISESKSSLNSIAPNVLYTITGAKKKNDVTFGLKTDFLFGGGGSKEFEGGGGAVILGLTVGAGFSSDLSKWAVRPEVGMSYLGAGAFLNYGVGFQFIIPGKKRLNVGN